MVASPPVLATKLYIAPPPPNVVSRARLIERLDKGFSARSKLSLISAPAGFGKTTLVSEWIAGSGHPAAWLSLDEGDGDLSRFLTYLVSAVRTLARSGVEGIAPDLGEAAMQALQASQSPPVESILTALLNEISTFPQSFLLVLDDYHVIESRAVDEALSFLVEHLPAQMHLVITTREDPALPLPRLRARRHLVELRAADLRFTPSEAAEFLDRVTELPLSAEEVAALEERTEGWIAGLQLAALSMRGHQDVSGFIRAFAGDNRYIVDYLMEEVLQRQPEPIRDFLLQTSILDRLSGPLCDAVTGQENSRARLEALQRGNFFLIPLDDTGHWYRYHHLFADVLRMHLMAEQPERVPVLHRRASEWYEQNGLAAEAIRHALSGEDFERAADLIERALPATRQNRQEATLLGWFQALPEELLRNRPVLNVHYVGTLLQNGQMEGVESRLRDVERWLDMPAELRERPIFVDEEDFQSLPGSVAMYRAAIALARGDVANATKYAREVLERAREEDDFMRGAASSLLGLASWGGGDLEAAHRMFSSGMAHLQKIGFISDVIGGCVTLADIRITQGRLREAMGTYERGLQLATKPGSPPLRGAADMHVGLSDVYRERNDLAAARQHLLKCQELGELNGLPKNPYRRRVAMARIHEAQGDLDEALDLLEEAEPLYQADFSPNVRPVRAWKARVWVAQGRLDRALDWVNEQGLSAHDDLSYLREFEHMTLARILLAQYRRDRRNESPIREALDLLERLRRAAEQGGRAGHLIEILVLQALAQQMHGDIPEALVTLEPALTLAEPEGYARIFLDEGADMGRLLREAKARGILPGYTGKLLGAFQEEGQKDEGDSAPPVSQLLIEPLSQRELDVLRLFRTELSGPEIAQELVIGLSTVRTHTKSIYSKLGVNSRRAAVKRGIELGLI
ncbi:MAG TPA: LuxR C-terminal-related transcriptional regulator [Anaerolineales bacterium]|nr:LuxR C-terminal-related transcriptional regulator [Anaerolineales bacterium]